MNSEQMNSFEERGYVILKGFLDGSVVESVRRGSDKLVTDFAKNMMAKGRLNALLEDEPFESRMLRVKEACGDVPGLFRSELHMEEFYPLFCNSRLLTLVSHILSTADNIRIFPNYSIRPKLPAYDPHVVVWHQDAGLSADGGPNTTPISEREDALGRYAIVNCWTPLVPATVKTGCMQFIPGSHKLGIQNHVLNRPYQYEQEVVTTNYGVYATEIDPEVIARHEKHLVHIECMPGDVVVFSHFLMHRGGLNTSDTVRWSVDWRYQDASKPTCREEKGHIVWSKADPDRYLIKSAKDWAKLKHI